MNGFKRTSDGVVLISVLLLVALATAIAAFLLGDSALRVRQSENLTRRAEAAQIARAGIDLASHWLRTETAAADRAIGDWRYALPPLPAGSAVLSGELRDEQGRLNLNNIVINGAPGPEFAALTRLFELLELDPRPIAALRDWIDADEDLSPGGAESQAYLALEPSYRSANRPLDSLESLYRVAGFDDKIIATIIPYVAVLPTGTALNLNTASPHVLAARFAMPLDDAKALVESRRTRRFENLSDFVARVPPPYQNQIGDSSRLTFTSQYFTAQATAQAGSSRVNYRALLRRTQPGQARIDWVHLGES